MSYSTAPRYSNKNNAADFTGSPAERSTRLTSDQRALDKSAVGDKTVADPKAIEEFRNLLKKVGSGTHTSKPLTREEAAIATEMMLTGAATPAQIGAFMIAHRIRRPTPTELAGMLDAYDALGSKIEAIDSEYKTTVFCNPYDGRSRTAPISPLTALILSAAQVPVVMPGSGRMPTKMGLPTVEIFVGLGADWTQLSQEQLQQVFEQTRLAHTYQPNHFPMAQTLVPYRMQIGKRPTLATVEIMWSPVEGACNVVSGYVHPPTEGRTLEAFTQREVAFFSTVKGLEGSCDIARSRTGIIGLNTVENGALQSQRLLLHPHEYGFDGADPEFVPLNELLPLYKAAITGVQNEISRSAVWNSGFYLWRAGRVDSIETGFELARSLLSSGAVEQQLSKVNSAINSAIRSVV